MNYEEDVRIDPDSLDVEWLGQAELGLKYGKHLARLHQIVSLAEEKKKTIRSGLILKANENPEQCCGKEKPNANDIEAYYRNHEDYKAAVAEYLDAQHEAEYAEVAKSEICFTRKAALENLVKLHGQMYFAGPHIPRNLSEEWNKKQKEVNEKIKMKRPMVRGK